MTTWQKAYELALEIYKVTKKFPKTEAYGLSSQLQRVFRLILLKDTNAIIEKNIYSSCLYRKVH